MSDPTPEPTDAQHAGIASLNDSYGVERWSVQPDGTVLVTLEDGDQATVSADGEAVLL